MKIIFDSEEQKELFVENVAGCPKDIGLAGDNEYCFTDVPCVKCWEESKIEMEVICEKKE